MSDPITISSEAGKRVIDFLREELQIPEGVIRFKVVLDMDALITVEDMDYFPQDTKTLPAR